MTRPSAASDMSLRLQIHEVEIGDNLVEHDLLVMIETDQLSGDPAAVIACESFDAEKGEIVRKPYINLTREQALLLGQFLMLASHCEEPE